MLALESITQILNIENQHQMSQQFMLRALEVSRNALPACQPNPPVGCVLVKDGQIVSEGYTQAIGGNHAEVEALKAYQGDLSEVTAYVTLEPCSFVGRTPACAATLVNCGIQKVVVAMLDPDPRNAGRGIDMLKAGGVDVEVGLCGEAASEFLTPYLGKS
ncbi:Diaminohydroxyphosphoribosylaminopyrimidine deaminase [Vibrio jasicida]|jgi:pyrimidine deaminase RibD-like protein|uniref:Diaminohydroxyphosphoribosylaminopyrimidine deaminase n=2 Tax=Vibrionaceae TaxID=641 RepID=A0AAU9QNZ8_9VIBR|nr:Diaminohydroxyphosphoribosylaminopyrimidine deaminase [Vibrio jasicida]CAH1594299.1 Diaminohydroxyphosphoribosylaminopyrimidine deaminase [Vibrio jasicida]